EGAAPTDLILPQSALALVDTQRNTLPHRRSDVRLGEALLVHPVTRLVHRRTEAVVETSLGVSGRHPHVVAMGAAAEGVGGTVESAAVEVEPDPFRDEAHEALLLLDRERQLVEVVARTPAAPAH